MRKALAYVNHGRFVADCPEPGCFDARAVYHPATGARQTEDVCANGHPFQIEMPPPQLEWQIVAELAKRPVDADRGWYPAGHVRAELAGFPTGQSVADLQAETREVEAFRAGQDAARAERLAALLAEHGIEVRPDGTFEGAI